jgi:hypothetical protein
VFLLNTANDNQIKRYKNRRINYELPVQVYRNRTKNCYSIRQNGRVVAHADRLCLKNCYFVVNEKLKQKAVKTGKRNVHAWIQGMIIGSGMGVTSHERYRAGVEVIYNPFLNEKFTTKNFVPEGTIKYAWMTVLNRKGVFVSYFDLW